MGKNRGPATAARAGRNAACRCGSGRKIKHCCGERRGPAAEQLARARLAVEGRSAARRLRHHDDEEMADLFDAMLELPELDHTMLVDRPRLHTGAVERLRRAIEDEDPEAMADALPEVLSRCDSPSTRLSLLEAVERLVDTGRIDRCIADAAIFDLSRPTSELIEVSVLQAVAVDGGSARTAGGLLVASF
jgi:hypothetical protein